MTRDSTFSYVHIDDSNKVLYMERWHDEPIPFDDIDTQSLMDATTSLFPQHLLEDDEDGAIPINSTTFGAKIYKNRKLLKDKAWNDLNFDKFLADHDNHPDTTILKPLQTQFGDYDILHETRGLTVGDFLSNGYMAESGDILDHHDDSILHQGDISLNSTSDLMPSNNTFLNLRTSSSTAQQPVHTPRIGRTRQLSTDKNFQTPITRIMR